MGTPCYMSPEQALGEKTDWRADLWSLAVLAFQCLTGKLPFFHEAIGGLLTQILYEPIPSIREANPKLPEAVEAWWRRASERDPERRFQNAAELSDALAAALGIEDPLVVPPVVPCSEALKVDLGDLEDAPGSGYEYAARMGSDAPVAMNTGELITRFRRRVKRRSAPWAWALVGALVPVSLGAAFWYRHQLFPATGAAPPPSGPVLERSAHTPSLPPPPAEEPSIETAPVTLSALPEASAAPAASSSEEKAPAPVAPRARQRSAQQWRALQWSAAPRSTPSAPPAAGGANAESEHPSAADPESSARPPERVRERSLPRLGPSPPRSRSRPPPRTRDYGI
jgi:serine/threonine-protein kinase